VNVADVISTYAGLLDALRSLPPPAEGRIRVFRGQNQEYPTMTPTALRAARGEDSIWPLYARWLSTAGSLTDLLADLADDSKVTAIHSTDGSTYVDTMLLWIRAIKQHYGPGTEFLDVTHSVGIAAWFALHSLQPEQVRANYAPPAAPGPWANVVGGHTFMRHTLFKGPAFLYAMDARVGSSANDLVHGMLFDIALAPEQFSSSARIRAQEACLIYANRSVDGGDLGPFIVPGTPLRIAWPLDCCPEVRKPTNQVFPSPREDDWYARFVAIPLAPNLDSSQAETVLDHPIDLTLYIPQGGSDAEDGAQLQDLIDRFRIPVPPLLYPKLADLDLPAWRGLADATWLYLEGPMMSTRMPLTETNIPMLASGLTRTAPVADYVTGEPAGDVSLENVFIEISALDEPYWEAFNRERPAISIIRGLWLTRDGDRFKLTTFMHDIATDEQYMIGPAEVVFDRKTGSYSARGGAQGAPWRPLRHRELRGLEYNVAMALGLVRSLSPVWKPGAWPILTLDPDGKSRTSSVALEWALGEILSLRSLGGPISSYHALRQWGTDAPFYGLVNLGSPALGGGLQFSGQQFAEMRLNEIFSRFASMLKAREGTAPSLPSRLAMRSRYTG
jgi:FRG domain